MRRWLPTFTPTRAGLIKEICLGKVYFNARFDDVMLIVKREMASVLRGPLPPALWGDTIFIPLMIQSRLGFIGTSKPGKLDFGYVD